MKIYISGPMTGYPDNNYPAFEYALQQFAGDAISPHNIHEDATDLSWAGYMRRDIAAMMKCDSIVMLAGWERSRGAHLEHDLAVSLEFTVYYSLAMAICEFWKKKNENRS